MQIVIDIPEYLIPQNNGPIEILLMCCGGNIGQCNFPFKVLPKGHGRIGDLDALKKEMQNYNDDCVKTSEYTKLGFETAIAVVENALPIIEADIESEDGDENV